MRRPRIEQLCGLLCIALAGYMALAGSPAWAGQVAHSPEVTFNGEDTPDGAFQYVFGVEADNSGDDGDVYVAVIEENQTLVSKVYRFDEDGGYAFIALDGSNTPEGSFSFSFFDLESFRLSFDGIAVDGSSSANKGDIYVADVEHRVIHRFDESGNYVCQITGTPTPSASECNGLAGSQTPNGGFVPSGLAVDESTGTLYVTDVEHNVIDKFDASGAFIGQIADSHLTQPSAIALDSTGAMYVVNGIFFDTQGVIKLDSSGAFVSVLAEHEQSSVAVDAKTDHVFVGGGSGTIEEYDASGTKLSAFPEGANYYLSLAVDGSSGRIYGGNFSFGESRVDTFSPETLVPDVAVAAPTGTGETAVTLNGNVDPAGAGDVVSCHFEYGLTSSRYQRLPCTPAAPYPGPQAVSTTLSGLSPSTTYHYRLAGANGGVSPYTRGVYARTADGTFSTVGHPTIEEERASNLERYSATLGAKINPRGFETKFKFEFVDAKHFDEEGGFASPATRSTSFSEIGDGLKPLSVNQDIGKLTVGTTYHFRVVAINERGTAVGPDATFTTVPVATIRRQWAYAHLKSATVEAKVNPLGLHTTCEVQYVSDQEFQVSGYAGADTQPCIADLGSGTQPLTARAELAALALDTTYHFRFVASNESGTLIGEDQSFATFGIESFSIEVLDEEGDPYTQAGGHPYQKVMTYRFNHTFVAAANDGTAPSLDGFIKDLFTEQPPGQSGARADEMPECPGYLAEQKNCPDETKVGSVTIEAVYQGDIEDDTRPLYKIIPPDGIASRYATLDPYTSSDTRVRSSSDYGVTTVAHNLSEEARAISLKVTTWGVPADHNSSGSPRIAILRNPTACGGPLEARVRMDTWEAPGEYATATYQMPPITGCDKLEFDPSIEWRPTSNVADSPTGLHVDIHQPQRTGPDELTYADLKDVVIKPAKGLIFNPSGANGLVGCTEAQFGYRQDTPAQCPDASKIGKVEIDTPLVSHPMYGGIYMAKPHDNPFGSMFAIYLAVDDRETGVVIKLAGEVQADARDGQLSASFSENPQLPVEDFKLDFFGGPLAVLRTPAECGKFPTESSLTPWSAPESGPPAHPTDSYEITAAPNANPCVSSEAEAPNRPAFRAGTVTPVAGAYSPFVMVLRREDGTQQIADVRVTPPPGLLGRLAGIPRCPDTALARAERRTGEEERAETSCAVDSEVGTVVVAAGAGPRPFHASGKVYLAGAYRGAPVSLAVVVPVVAGPFDLGTVVVRSPLDVDFETGQVAVRSDSIPTILEGVPLNIRTIAVRLDRPEFTVNPTNCDATVTNGAVVSLAGQLISLSEPFQLGECEKLRFAPKVRLRLFGKTRRRSHPGLRAVLTIPKGGANIARVVVSMPPTVFLDTSHIRGVCTNEQYDASACPANSVYGYSKVWTPLLDQPLAGPIYMRASDHGLPDLVAELNGEFRLAVAGRIGSLHGAIRANVADLPDVPATRFVMTMLGGGRGLLQNAVDACARPQRGRIELEGQNGKVVTVHPLLRAKCQRAANKRRRHVR